MSIRGLLVTVGLLVAAGTELRGQQPYRFEITAVGDTTLSFRSAGAGWLKPGVVGVAVDPRRRDQLVARFRVIAVREGMATAIITGQTTDVSADHVATVLAPAARWYRRGAFWAGLLLGALLGAAGGAAA